MIKPPRTCRLNKELIMKTGKIATLMTLVVLSQLTLAGEGNLISEITDHLPAAAGASVGGGLGALLPGPGMGILGGIIGEEIGGAIGDIAKIKKKKAICKARGLRYPCQEFDIPVIYGPPAGY